LPSFHPETKLCSEMRRALLTLGALSLWACTPTESEPARPISAPAPPAPPDTALGAPTAGPPATPTPEPPTDAADGIVPCARSPADIMTVVGRHSQALNKCLIAGQKHKRLAKGTRTVDLEFLVMPSGKIEGVRVHEEDTRDSSLQICVGKVLETTRFPAVKGGTCPISLPLNVALPTRPKKPRRR
jgi:hypothetical protein